MLANRLTQLALVAALVFAQTVYASHDGSHLRGGQADCQICLHASTAGSALPGQEVSSCVAPALAPAAAAPETCPHAARLHFSHPARGPPLSQA